MHASWLAATGLLLAACGVGPIGATPTGPGTSPVATSTAAAATAKPAVLPASLRYQWIRDPQPIPGLVPPPNVTSLKLAARSLGFYANVAAGQNPETILDSTAGVTGDGTLSVVLQRDGSDCHAGDAGSYELTPSASGLALTVRPYDDVCAIRKAAIAGEWTRVSCPSAPQWCLGDLDAGAHVSINYLPFVKAPDWQFNYGRFAYTVPDGWRNQEDSADGYVLIEQDGADGAGIFVFSDVLAHAQTKDCASKPAAGVGSSAASIYGWIRTLPGLKVTNVAKDVRVGGLLGYRIDLDIDPRSAGTCPWTEGKQAVDLFVNAQYANEEAFDWGIGGDGRMRLFILEEGPDRTLLIDIEAQEEATWQALVPKAMPIVESFDFRH